MINDYTYEALYQMYLNRQVDEIEQIVLNSKVYELKQWTRDNNTPWYQGSKASFLQQLRVHLAQSRVIRGDSFR